MADIVTSGASPAYAIQMTSDIINAKWNHAQDWFARAFEFGEGVKADVGDAPHILAEDLATSLSMVPPPANLAFSDPEVAKSYFEMQNEAMNTLIEEAFKKIVEIVFPDMESIRRVFGWCSRAIMNGGTGINVNVESALWERGRARLLRQAERDAATMQEQYARAGWPLPPGAMLHAISNIRQDSRDKLAEQSRDITVKSFETEVENIKFAITTISGLFNQAFQTANDYVRTVMLGPQTAAQLASSMSGLENDAARTLVSLYQAQSAALEPFLRLEIADAELKMKAQEANLRAKMDTAQIRAQAALANLKMVGDAAAASLNGIGADVGTRASLTEQFSY